MNKTNAPILGCLILATLFGLFGQDLAYFLNEHLVKIPPIYYLTVATIISVILYLCSFVLTYLQYKKRRIEKDKAGLYFSVCAGMGMLTSFWSLFVLAMWWG